ncbi:MAG: ATP-binding protein [Bacteroidales bacterium]|nr:ATP-binding protein [Bacteroidales bacterium]
MKIQRELTEQLKLWKSDINRMPILLKGARQTGKTWIMEEFGRNYFDHVAVFNFDKTQELAEIFEKTKDVHRIVKELALYTEVPLIPGKTLLVFDEIQACEGALNSLKYFSEDAPQYHLISAGSLLGVAVRKKNMSVPVGKVQIMNLYPVTFKEFLRASDPQTFTYINSHKEIAPLPGIVFQKLKTEYSRYLVSGGMPKAVSTLLTEKGIQTLDNVLQNILELYTLDFSKYVSSAMIPRINHVWESLPSQLAKENKKFVYNVVKTGARAREYEEALLWLEEAGLIYRIFNVSKPGLPLSAYRELSHFKIYACDCGLLRRLARLPAEAILSQDQDPLIFTRGFSEFKGSLTENAVLQSLIPQFDGLPYYWSSQNRAEVDFLLQYTTNIIPIEVKAGKRVSGKSLSVYNSKFSPSVRIRFSMKNLDKNNGLLSIPSFLADWISKYVHSALH